MSELEDLKNFIENNDRFTVTSQSETGIVFKSENAEFMVFVSDKNTLNGKLTLLVDKDDKFFKYLTAAETFDAALSYDSLAEVEKMLPDDNMRFVSRGVTLRIKPELTVWLAHIPGHVECHFTCENGKIFMSVGYDNEIVEVGRNIGGLHRLLYAIEEAKFAQAVDHFLNKY